MTNIFSSNDALGSLPPLVGMEIMQIVQRSAEKETSLFDIFDRVKSRPWFSPRVVYYALVFLFAAGLINFDGVHVSVVENATG